MNAHLIISNARQCRLRSQDVLAELGDLVSSRPGNSNLVLQAAVRRGPACIQRWAAWLVCGLKVPALYQLNLAKPHVRFAFCAAIRRIFRSSASRWRHSVRNPCVGGASVTVRDKRECYSASEPSHLTESESMCRGVCLQVQDLRHG